MIRRGDHKIKRDRSLHMARNPTIQLYVLNAACKWGHSRWKWKNFPDFFQSSKKKLYDKNEIYYEALTLYLRTSHKLEILIMDVLIKLLTYKPI
jgi:hypothetical protein